MPSQWTYLVVVLCVSVTSSAVLDLPGNRVNCHGDECSDVRQEETLTPPLGCAELGKQINSHLNEAICRELCKKGDGGNACLCDWPPLKKEILFALKHNTKDNPTKFFNFATAENDPACKVLCSNGDGGHFCWCKK